MRIDPKDIKFALGLAAIGYVFLFFLSFGVLNLWAVQARSERMKNKNTMKSRLIDKRWKRVCWVMSSFLLIPATIAVLVSVIKAPFEVALSMRRFTSGQKDK